MSSCLLTSFSLVVVRNDYQNELKMKNIDLAIIKNEVEEIMEAVVDLRMMTDEEKKPQIVSMISLPKSVSHKKKTSLVK